MFECCPNTKLFLTIFFLSSNNIQVLQHHGNATGRSPKAPNLFKFPLLTGSYASVIPNQPGPRETGLERERLKRNSNGARCHSIIEIENLSRPRQPRRSRSKDPATHRANTPQEERRGEKKRAQAEAAFEAGARRKRPPGREQHSTGGRELSKKIERVHLTTGKGGPGARLFFFYF